jgi:hypothetical protein
MQLGVSSRRVANGLSGNTRYLLLWQPIAFPKLHSVISKFFMQPSSFQLLFYFIFAKKKKEEDDKAECYTDKALWRGI